METSSIFENLEPRLVQASQGKRFANYFIDGIAFYLVVIVLYVIASAIDPSWLDEEPSGGFSIVERIVSLIIYALFLGSLEALTKGKTLGKLITKTKAVNNDGSPISTKTAFLRGFARAVPFCVFSALSTPCYPWQDRWTDTYVIDEKESSTGSETF